MQAILYCQVNLHIFASLQCNGDGKGETKYVSSASIYDCDHIHIYVSAVRILAFMLV